MQDVTNPVSLLSFILYVGCSVPPRLCVIRHYFSHDESNRLSQTFASNTFDLFSEVSKFQHHTELCGIQIKIAKKKKKL
jgi:hypothetical protein